MAIGLDCGTAFYIAAREKGIKLQRNAFLTIDGNINSVKRMLLRKKIPWVESNNRINIVGAHAFDYAQIFSNAELKRPMRSGLLNPGERDALPVLKSIIKSLVGTPQKDNELCVYCVPSKPLDKETLVDYHEDVLGNIITSLGFKARSIEESVALAYEGLIDEDLTGIAISMGAGMCNVAIMYEGIVASSFSVSKGGDFIDEHASMDTGIPKAKIQYAKESATMTVAEAKVRIGKEKLEVIDAADLTNAENAIKTYYGVLINYLLSNITNIFDSTKNIPNFPKPISIVIGGGTSLIPGFIELFQAKFNECNFPLAVKDIRLVEDTHKAVAKGCLSEALLEGDDGE